MVAPTLKRGRRFPLLFVWGAFALLAAGALSFRASPPPAPSETGPPPAPARLSPAPLAEIGAVEVIADGAYYRFERAPDGLWFRHAHAGPAGGGEGQGAHRHVGDPATSDAIARALSAFLDAPAVAARGDGDATSRGVAPPQSFVVLYRPGEDKPLAGYPIGFETPDGRSRYVGLPGSGAVVEAAGEGVSALLALLDDSGDRRVREGELDLRRWE